MCPHPHIFAEHDGRGIHPAPLFWVKVVVERCNDDLVPDQAPVAQHDAALVLKTAARIDEHVFADMDIFAEVGVKGRKETKALVRFLPRELRKERAQLPGGVIARIELRRHALRLTRRFRHEQVRLRPRRDITPSRRERPVFFQFHALPLLFACIYYKISGKFCQMLMLHGK